MDLSALFAEAAKLGFIVLLLLAAVYMLVKRQDRMEAERKEREKQERDERDEREERERLERVDRERIQRENCAREIASLVADVRALQASRYDDARNLLEQAMGVLRLNAESFGRLVDIQKQTGSGQHPTVRGG